MSVSPETGCAGGFHPPRARSIPSPEASASGILDPLQHPQTGLAFAFLTLLCKSSSSPSSNHGSNNRAPRLVLLLAHFTDKEKEAGREGCPAQGPRPAGPGVSLIQAV